MLNIDYNFNLNIWWISLVQNVKLSYVFLFQLPYFMNELTLTELDMGSATPRILGASKPSIDYQGKREITLKPEQTQKHTLNGFHKDTSASRVYNASCVICWGFRIIFWQACYQAVFSHPQRTLSGFKAPYPFIDYLPGWWLQPY